MGTLNIAQRVLAVMLAAGALGTACAGPRTAATEAGPSLVEGVAPSPAPAAPPSNLGTIERYAWQAVKQMGSAIEAGDAQGFLGKVSQGFYRGYAALDASVRDLISKSGKRSLAVTVQDVKVEDGRVRVRSRWALSSVLKDGTRSNASGETIFLFLKGEDALRLLDYQGDPPFGIAGL